MYVGILILKLSAINFISNKKNSFPFLMIIIIAVITYFHFRSWKFGLLFGCLSLGMSEYDT